MALSSGPREKRTYLQIVQAVLEVAHLGARKTRIMYGANLSFEQLNKYLGVLMRSDLIRRGESDGVYQVTEKGRRFLRGYDELRKAEDASRAIRDVLDRMLPKPEARRPERQVLPVMAVPGARLRRSGGGTADLRR